MAKKKDKKEDEIPQKKEEVVATKPKDGKEIQEIVRVVEKDLKGNMPLRRAITSVNGVGYSIGSFVADVAYKELGVTKDTLVGELTEKQIDQLENIMNNITEYGVPEYLLNKRKEGTSGKNKHLIGTDLAYSIKQDVDREKSSQSWRGMRHMFGKKVRGQRTRSTGRRGLTVGVMRKSVLAKSKPAGGEKEKK